MPKPVGQNPAVPPSLTCGSRTGSPSHFIKKYYFFSQRSFLCTRIFQVSHPKLVYLSILFLPAAKPSGHRTVRVVVVVIVVVVVVVVVVLL